MTNQGSHDYIEIDRFIGERMAEGVTDPAALARLTAERFGDEGREALRKYVRDLADIAEGEGFGTQTVEQGAEVIVRYALITGDGPTGGFFSRSGAEPW